MIATKVNLFYSRLPVNVSNQFIAPPPPPHTHTFFRGLLKRMAFSQPTHPSCSPYCTIPESHISPPLWSFLLTCTSSDFSVMRNTTSKEILTIHCVLHSWRISCMLLKILQPVSERQICPTLLAVSFALKELSHAIFVYPGHVQNYRNKPQWSLQGC